MTLNSYLLSDDKQLDLFFASLDIKKRYLLALSGGSDSLFLFYLLKERGVSFTAVHIDHCWRTTSSQEAKELEQLCLREDVPFVLHVLTLEEQGDKDLENQARKKRYALLYKSYRQLEAEGIFLAHHANDQAETILKRLLEGAHLTNLKAMAEKSYVQDILLLRPLLHIPKSTLTRALDAREISYIRDPSNEDERYLRARMRKKIFPWLDEVFGKNVTFPLITLGEESAELSDYIEVQAQPFLCAVTYENSHRSLPFPDSLVSQTFLGKWVLKQFFNNAGAIVSRHFLQMVYDHLSQGSCATIRMRNKSVIIKPRVVMID
ncbi:tRNA(Ile)-lysidine synthase,tRNA(Ile)-lysidine synthetase,Predicted ATPase of the PP-loop superfamily implicated in cell cycle control,tRNA(Ile)-lysidine synthetase,PP-loop family [Chlamydia serpentis]|uniref:tRNA(Ile)-lysidine synthase n=1 Tax=Chlamydia serpentis TaxID=1967782 RepID=A0A2R8FCN4_9CHLA|nr:tRNA lysidine(34) synthetase TilS [Chlamydia serpentis]SPN74102.1 tRNA(Ile)-lysidine synthase,tRNA(Ile)-lysidine synthetase,Predicted ATPase of the PP-loop superfamily implicated in cell cycle control,tRNA(Ile)-lysidine synthetase,PP-loop family [Chlamydia serpentis]